LASIIDLRKFRQKQPWNPKLYNCHDFIAEHLPLLVAHSDSSVCVNLQCALEDGVLSTRKNADALFGGRGSCLSKVIEVYVRYIGGFKGSWSCTPKQSLDSPSTMVYSGYNRHPLQKGSSSDQICPASWQVSEVSVLFRQQPCPHWSLWPLGVSRKNIQRDYKSKAMALRQLGQEAPTGTI